MSREKPRCAWARLPLAVAYHDREWGVPVKTDRKLFEFLILEGAQAGLSWDTILAKRENYRRAFHGFDWEKIARYTAADRRRLLADAGIVRNRAKVAAAIVNARCFMQVREEFGTFSRHAWSFVGGQPIVRRPGAPHRATSPESDAFSADLRRRGFKFVGSTILYAFMQAVGMVNDHDARCFRRRAAR